MNRMDSSFSVGHCSKHQYRQHLHTSAPAPVFPLDHSPCPVHWIPHSESDPEPHNSDRGKMRYPLHGPEYQPSPPESGVPVSRHHFPHSDGKSYSDVPAENRRSQSNPSKHTRSRHWAADPHLQSQQFFSPCGRLSTGDRTATDPPWKIRQ